MLIPFQRQFHFLSLSCIKQHHTLNCTLSAVIVETAAEDWVWAINNQNSLLTLVTFYYGSLNAGVAYVAVLFATLIV